MLLQELHKTEDHPSAAKSMAGKKATFLLQFFHGLLITAFCSPVEIIRFYDQMIFEDLRPLLSNTWFSVVSMHFEL